MKKHLQKITFIALMLLAFQMPLIKVWAQPAPTTSGPFGSTLATGTNGETKYWDGAQWIAVPPGLPGQSLQFAPRWIDNAQGLTTTPVIVVNNNSAIGGGNIASNGGANIIARGICWSLYPNPTIANNFILDDSIGKGNFSCNLIGLTPGSTYHVRAYASNISGTAYGNDMTFTTTGIMPILTVVDYDGNVYDTVKIGTQIWLKQNLSVTHYNNGDAITYITDNNSWTSSITGAYCDYNNNVNNSTTYGRLYNWYTVVDNRNLCPIGWHVPIDAEWASLTSLLGGDSIAGNKLKEAGTIHWSLNAAATNASGFTALPGGRRMTDGGYYYIGLGGYWWSSTEYNFLNAWYLYMGYNGSWAGRGGDYKNSGISVRCIKD